MTDWRLSAVLIGNFTLASKLHFNNVHHLHPSLQELTLQAETIEDNRQSGAFKLECLYSVSCSPDQKPQEVAADTGREILARILDILVFLVGPTIRLREGLTLVRDLEKERQKECILFGEYAQEGLPPRLEGATLLTSITNFTADRAFRWLRKALEQEESDDKFIALCIAMDILGQATSCEKGSSIREKIVAFLTGPGQLAEKVANESWDLRNKVFHGGLIITPDERRRLADLANHLAQALIRGLKRLLGVEDLKLSIERIAVRRVLDNMLVLQLEEPEATTDHLVDTIERYDLRGATVQSVNNDMGKKEVVIFVKRGDQPLVILLKDCVKLAFDIAGKPSDGRPVTLERWGLLKESMAAKPQLSPPTTPACRHLGFWAIGQPEPGVWLEAICRQVEVSGELIY